jgi:hypothetical protein
MSCKDTGMPALAASGVQHPAINRRIQVADQSFNEGRSLKFIAVEIKLVIIRGIEPCPVPGGFMI